MPVRPDEAWERKWKGWPNNYRPTPYVETARALLDGKHPQYRAFAAAHAAAHPGQQPTLRQARKYLARRGPYATKRAA